MKFRFDVAIGLFWWSRPVTSPLSFNATHLVNRIAGSGITIVESKVFLTSPKQAELFSKASGDKGIGLASGVVLSSAWATNEQGVNDNRYPAGSDDLRGGGYHAFARMLPSDIGTGDGCILQIKFTCTEPQPILSFEFVFGTDDYPWTGTSQANMDMMGAFLNGEMPEHNFALPYGRQLIVNSTTLNVAYKDNKSRKYQTEMNGFTQPFTAATAVSDTAENVLHIAVSDTGKTSGNSLRKKGAWLFITSGSLKCSTPTPTPVTFTPTLEPTQEGTEEFISPSGCASYCSVRCKCSDQGCVNNAMLSFCDFDPDRYTERAYKKKVLKHFRRTCKRN